jgi:serine/threonine-protein kinase
MARMPDAAIQVDVGSTLVALARTLDSDGLGAALGLTTMPAPHTDTPSPGAEIELHGEQRYQTLTTLGEGGMGQVGAVWDRDLMRELALKQLHPRLARDRRALQRFIWEARVTAHLDHPNIVPVHDLGLDGAGALYFTMKRVRGRSLAELIDALARLDGKRVAEVDCCAHHRCHIQPGEDTLLADYGPRKRRLRVFVDICQAIAYAHDRGVLHRDLKPANVMIGEFGEVLVMDWGLALPLPIAAAGPLAQLLPSTLDETDDALYGTPRYMAPELLRGEPASVRTDIYALGVLLYELLAFRRPHDGDSIPALVRSIVEGQVVPLRQVAPELPSSIVAVVAKAMAVDPSQRYASVAELIEDVETVNEGLTPRAEPASNATWLRRYFWSRDNPATAGLRLVDLDLTGAAGVLVGIAVTLAWTQGPMQWPVWALAVAALGLMVSPMSSYLRAVRAGRRSFLRQRAGR